MSQEKSHPPSRRRRARARRDGKVLKSQLLSRVCCMGGVFGLLAIGAQFCWVRWSLLLKWQLTEGFTEPLASCREVVLSGFLILALLLGLGAGVAWLVEVVQVGLSVEFGVLALRFERLEPVGGIRRHISGLRGVWWQCSIIGLAAILVLGFFTHATTMLVVLDPFDLFELASAGSHLLRSLTQGGFVVLFLVSVVDLLIQKGRFFKDLGMSHEEVKREHREEEGDPLIRSRRRLLHEEISMHDSIRRIRRARVIVVEKESSM